MTLVPFPDAAPASPAPFGEFIQPARNFICEIWQEHPGWILNGSGQGLPGAVALMDRVCPPGEAPSPPPPAPLPGGQCPVLYNVRLRVDDTFSDGSTQSRDITAVGSPFVGPIRGLKYEESPPNSFGTIGQTWFVLSGDNQQSGVVLGSRSGLSRRDVTLIGTERVDGQLDTCGDGLPRYPDTVPPSGDLTTNITIDIGGTNVLLPITIAPVIIAPTLNFEPHIAVRIGAINLDFSLGGVDVSIPPFPNSPPQFPTGSDPRNPAPAPRIPRPPQSDPNPLPPGGGGGECPDVDISPVITLLTELDDKYATLLDCDRCEPDEPSPLNYDEVLVFEGSSGQIALPKECVFVRLDLVIDLSSVKTQSGGNAPNVFYIGWQSFKSFNGNQVRQPIHYQNSIYPVPRLSQAFTFTCYNGLTAKVILVKTKED